MSLETTQEILDRHPKIDTIDDLKEDVDTLEELLEWLKDEADNSNNSWSERCIFNKVIVKCIDIKNKGTHNDTTRMDRSK